MTFPRQKKKKFTLTFQNSSRPSHSEVQVQVRPKEKKVFFFKKKNIYVKKKKKGMNLTRLSDQSGQSGHPCNIRSIRCYPTDPSGLSAIRSFLIRMIRFLIGSDDGLNGFHRSTPLT